MTSSNPPNPIIYPDYCHSLSLTISRWCPLRAVDIHALRSVGMYDGGKEIYHHLNHPIKWVRLTGVIVAIDDFTTKKILTLDDSSGMCIECSCASPPPPATAPPPQSIPAQARLATTDPNPKPRAGAKPAREYQAVRRDAKTLTVAEPLVPWLEMDVGSVVKVKGQITKYWDEKRVDVIKIEVLRGTGLEVRCWDEALAFRREVLNVPWVVGRDEEERCRRMKAVGGAGGKKVGNLGRKEKNGRRGAEERLSGRDGDGMKMRDRESEDIGRESKHLERRERPDSEKKRKKEQEMERGPRKLDPANKINYPSLAVRRSAAGKYDALGI